MGTFSLAQRTSITASGSATQELITGANNAAKIMEYGLSQVTAVAGTYGLGLPAAKGIGATSPVAGQNEDTGDTQTTSALASCVAWGTTAPTVPTNFFRRLTCPATIGAGTIWTFPKGLKLLKSQAQLCTLVLWIIATAPVLDTWWVADE